MPTREERRATRRRPIRELDARAPESPRSARPHPLACLLLLLAGCPIDNPAWQESGRLPATDASGSATATSATSDTSGSTSTSGGITSSTSTGPSTTSTTNDPTSPTTSTTVPGTDATSSDGSTTDATGGGSCDGCTECQTCVDGACMNKGAGTPCGESIHCEDYAAKQAAIGEVSACYGFDPQVVNGKCDGAGTCDPLAACVIAATPFVSCGPACLGDGAACTKGASKSSVIDTMCYIDEESPMCSSFCGGMGFVLAACGPAGTCKKAMAIPCQPYQCTQDGCKTQCTIDADCVGGFYCAANVCVPM